MNQGSHRMIGEDKLYMLTKGTNAGAVRPCKVVCDHGDGTVDVTVFTLGPADGLDQHCLHMLHAVPYAALGDDPDSAVANGRRVIRETRDRLAKEAEQARKRATMAKNRAQKSESAIERAQREAREAEAELEQKQAELERMSAEAERWSEEAEAERTRAERVAQSAPSDPHGDTPEPAEAESDETPSEPQEVEG